MANPNPVDIHVGARLRLRRTLLGFSQEKLGNAVGLTFQQIQKYERGTNRIGSSRLYHFSQILDVPVSFFFEELPDEKNAAGSGLSEPGGSFFESADWARRETLELVRAYYKIPEKDIRKRVFDLVKAIGGSKDAEKDDKESTNQ